MINLEKEKYERAKKRVHCIKGFYNHLIVYIAVNLMILAVTSQLIPVLFDTKPSLDLQSWLDWNTYGIPFIWGIGLLIHGLFVFKHKVTFFDEWEKNKIQELLNNDDTNNDNRWN